MYFPTWQEFIKNKKNTINESFEKMKKDATLKTGEFVTKNSVGYRMDSDYENDPKEYDKLQKFTNGTNRPDPIPTKDGWFVVDEATGQIWHNNEWINPSQVDNLDSAILKNEESAEVLASVVSGIPVQSEVFKKALGAAGKAKQALGKTAGYLSGKTQLSPERMRQAKYPTQQALTQAAQKGDKEAMQALKQQAMGKATAQQASGVQQATKGAYQKKNQKK